ncbi:MAG: hypothetical protein HY300_03180 [Verrucomicrobia bacterium]|nr:hypothetical protein [Verrucomicrobiota bacterium]
MINLQQMELTLDNAKLAHAPRRQRRMARASWWFEQMHLAVERATSPSLSVPPPRPQQGCLSLASRRA